jgi:predicted deacylase
VVAALNRAARKQGARLVVFNGVPEYWDKNQSNALLTEVAHTNAIPYLDLVPPMKDYAQRTGEYVFGCSENGGHGHWSRVGHAQAATLMYKFLQSNGLLP